MSQNRVFPCIGFLAGVIAVIFAIVLLAHPAVSGLPTGEHTSYSYYGGDAYTGIQQAAADTARNVKALAEIVLSGFRSVGGGNSAGYILLVMGFGLIAVSGAKLTEYKAAALYEQAVLNALKGKQAPEQAPRAAETPRMAEPPVPPANRWRMDTAWPVADPGAVARKAEAIVTEPAAETSAAEDVPVEVETPAEEAPVEAETPADAENPYAQTEEETRIPGED